LWDDREFRDGSEIRGIREKFAKGVGKMAVGGEFRPQRGLTRGSSSRHGDDRLIMSIPGIKNLSAHVIVSDDRHRHEPVPFGRTSHLWACVSPLWGVNQGETRATIKVRRVSGVVPTVPGRE
jgi:hypothetical protein